ncbi:hypothetical protein QBC35DRAFT_555849 [Podospora australis]|uniref:Uncharacterized protein n=1 Tax=Podospora australis TaxID=1536484 RepID=A0AAN6WST9_9PEZI|nr:hypothetical protein QBC35DRAFT_555849 [Podospora australis]
MSKIRKDSPFTNDRLSRSIALFAPYQWQTSLLITEWQRTMFNTVTNTDNNNNADHDIRAQDGCNLAYILEGYPLTWDETVSYSLYSTLAEAYMYGRNCGDEFSCIPSQRNGVEDSIYSPGLGCPLGWTTATILSRGMTDSVRAWQIFSTLYEDELDAICCPSGFAFVYENRNCESTMVECTFSYRSCIGRAGGVERTITLGATLPLLAPWSMDGPESVSPTASSSQVIRQAITQTPALQLVYRTLDRSATTSATAATHQTNSLSSGGHLSTGEIVATSVMATLGAALILAVFWILARRSRKRRRIQDENDTQQENTPELSADMTLAGTELGSKAKPELPVSPQTPTTLVEEGVVRVVSPLSVAYELESVQASPRSEM